MSTAKVDGQRGSVWRKWDLHLHAPGTTLANDYGDPSDPTIWNRFIEILEGSEVQAFGITDYFSFAGYLATVAKYKELVPNGTKLFIPNLELRLIETVSTDGRNVNTHVLIDPTVASPEKLQRFLNDLVTHISVDGRRLRCTELHPGNYAAATVSIHDVKQALDRCFASEDYLIVTAAGNDGLRGAAKNTQRSKSISDELDKASHAFFGKSGSTNFFLSAMRYEGSIISEPKPLFDGSDAHSFKDLDRLTGDEPNFQSTWIKANLSFRGLRQTLFEPAHRVFIGDRPSVLTRMEREATRFIEKLEISCVDGYANQNGTWFKNVSIPFNPELTAIIGNKGSGKSAIADILALLGNTRQAKYFSFLTDNAANRKFKRPGYAEHFRARLTWKTTNTVEKLLNADTDILQPEAVKYLPQNYFESLTNEIEVQELRREIEDVVFSHIDVSDKVDASSFRELQDKKTAHSKQDASQLKAKLRELNLKILELEEQSAPAFRSTLVGQLEVMKREVASLEASKPPVETQPETESEAQKIANDRIAVQTSLLETLITKEKELVSLLGSQKVLLQQVNSLQELILGIKTRVDADKASLRERFGTLGFDLDAALTVQVDTVAISQKADEIRAEIAKLDQAELTVISPETDISKLSSIPDVRLATTYVSDNIVALREALSAPQQRYQKYVQAVREITEKITAIVGDKSSPQVGTIAELEARIERIDSSLATEISKAYSDRHTLCSEIFDCKKKVKSFYEDLKSKVESRLKAVSTGDFTVSIDASFVVSPRLHEEFFSHLNQNVVGPFRGLVDGSSLLRQKLAAVDWNDLSSILSFTDGVIESMKAQDIKRQTKDVKKFYDFLYSLEYFDARYELRLGGKDLNQLSPGEKGLLLLVFYLHLDLDNTPLIIDQPEDNLDNDSIFAVLSNCIREAKKTRQVILVTHNPNLAVGADAEQIVYVKLDKVRGYKFSYESGAIENPSTNNHIVKVLEGSRPAFVQRRLKYQIG